MRIDLYSTIHKTQRFHLFQLAERLGRADQSRPESWPPLAAEVQIWLDHLEAHAQHEHDFIHPLFERGGDIAMHLDAEHEALSGAMAEIKQTLAAGDWEQLYGRFVAFLGVYLVHIT
jgi:iron-sulfur cluster repair protein YtfE (RIC family)